ADEIFDEIIPGRGEEFIRCTDLFRVTVFEKTDSVAQFKCFLNIMRHEYDGLSDLLLEFHKVILQLLPADRVESAERLIHQNDRWICSEGADDADALLLTSGKFGWFAVFKLFRVHPDHVQQFIYASIDIRFGPFLHERHLGDILLDGHMREQG